MKTPPDKHCFGIVAILDALGTATFEAAAIERFVDSRKIVLESLEEKAEELLGPIHKDQISTFTFNDTILVIFRKEQEPSFEDIRAFFRIIRKFFVDSLTNGILFRGSIATGQFYADNKTNTVLGNAVADAAAWYNKAEWIGIHTTPRTTITIQRMIGREKKWPDTMSEYDVPLKEGSSVRAVAVNWPTAFYLKLTISPEMNGSTPKQKLLEFLGQHQVPFGTESKFYKTLEFFDYSFRMHSKKKPGNTAASA